MISNFVVMFSPVDSRSKAPPLYLIEAPDRPLRCMLGEDLQFARKWPSFNGAVSWAVSKGVLPMAPDGYGGFTVHGAAYDYLTEQWKLMTSMSSAGLAYMSSKEAPPSKPVFPELIAWEDKNGVQMQVRGIDPDATHVQLRNIGQGSFAPDENNPCSRGHVFIWTGTGTDTRAPEGMVCACGMTVARYVRCSECGAEKLEPALKNIGDANG